MLQLVTLLPRPRRFGKTLNMSMLKYFFDMNENSSHLFKDFEIWRCEQAKEHLNKYPVISVSFKDTSVDSWKEAKEDIKEIIAKEFKRHKEDEKEVLDNGELENYELIENMKAPGSKLRRSLKNLSEYLERKHNKK